MLSTLQENRITLERAINELRMVDDSDYWETDDELSCDFAIIPEIVAGAVGYALSDLRRVGLHLMIDIGASTVDMCSFILHQADGGDRYSLLVTDVKLLGTIRLHHERIASIQHYHERRSQDLRDSHDPLMPITDDIEPYILRREEMINEIRAAEDELKAECMKMMKLIIRDAKQRDPNSSVWRTGRLPILLIGGGSQLPFFSSTVEKLDGWLREFDINEGTILMQVTVPESLLSQTDDYYRLVVAWGLSHREFDIGEVTPASRIMAVEQPPHQDWEERYIGPEQI
ncbi:MAG: hypothetical protein AVO35_12830 [Candidatus Aegiribacteria sp. MLS_C]|nr:MAG: hypothetical protein AVO35_12830 [Candidatus Aegiribacteria sp. MLS_C]